MNESRLKTGQDLLNSNYSAFEKALLLGYRNLFDWDNPDQVLEKIKEEVFEVVEALANKDKEHLFEELSDVLITLVQLFRKLEWSPEECLNFAIEKYNLRASEMFKLAKDEIPESEMTAQLLDPYWEISKKNKKEEVKQRRTVFLKASSEAFKRLTKLT